MHPPASAARPAAVVGTDPTVLRLHGVVDFTTESSFRAEAEQLLRGRSHTGLVVDMGEVSFIDSTGLGLLVQLKKAAAAQLVPMVLRHVSDRTRGMLELTGLDQVLPVEAAPAAPGDWPGLQLQPLVHVDAIDAASAFYTALGGELVSADADRAVLRFGTTPLSLVTHDAAAGQVELSFTTTEPLSVVADQLGIAGVEVLDGVDPSRLTLRAPDGSLLTVHHLES